MSVSKMAGVLKKSSVFRPNYVPRDGSNIKYLNKASTKVVFRANKMPFMYF